VIGHRFEDFPLKFKRKVRRAIGAHGGKKQGGALALR
jgi:hypothetical protein